MTQRFVGVDLGTHRVKVVVTTSGLRGIQVLRIYEEAVEIGPDGGAALDEAVSVAIAVLREKGLTDDAIGVSLPGNAASYRLIQFPFTDARRIAQAVPFEADGQFPVPLEEMRYDHVIAGGQGAGGRALVVATRAARAEAVADAFSEAGIQLKLITAGPIGLAQALEPEIPPIPVEEGEEEVRVAVALVVDLGHRTTEFTALGDKGPVMARTVRVGGRDITAALSRAYRMDPMEAEASKQCDGFVPHRGLGEMSKEQMDSGKVVAGALEPVVRELEHTRMWLRASHGYEVTRLILAGGGAMLSGLDNYLAEQTGLPVGRVGSQITPAVKSTDRDWTAHIVALGTAMATARRPLVQLHHAAGGAGDVSFLQERMSTLMTIAVAIMAFGALDTIARVKALEAEKEVRMEELARVSREVLGDEITIAAEIESRLAEVDAQDLTSLVPSRGALEVLGFITEAAKPQDADKEAAGTAGAGAAPREEVDPLGMGVLPPDGILVGEARSDTDGENHYDKPLRPVVDASSGIFRDDELIFSIVDIREMKVDIKASATRSSAQDRLAIKLGKLGCLTNISKGRVRDQNERKVFEMSMDNTCFSQDVATEEEG